MPKIQTMRELIAPPSSRDIPDPIKREVRQRCGFGCVLCGIPLFEYDHLLGWANVSRHVADEITLLCDQHHREKTAGLLPIQTVIGANQEPFNRRNGRSRPYQLHYSGNRCEIVIGSNTFTADPQGTGVVCAISVDETQLVAFQLENGVLLLNLQLFDDCNQLVMEIHENQLAYSIAPWDIQFVGQNLVLREASRKILLDVSFQVPDCIVINRGRFLRNGVEILVRPEELIVVNNGLRYSGNSMNACRIGLAIGPHNAKSKCLIRVEDVKRDHRPAALVEQWIDEAFGRTLSTTAKPES